MKRQLPLVIGVIAIVGVGIVHGFWTDRWTISNKIRVASERLDQLPMTVGDWEGKPLDMSGSNQSGIAREVFRRYSNKRTGDEVLIALVCGRAGPVCIHTPDVCYGASGYKVGPRATVPVVYRGGEGEFFTSDAIKSKAAERTSLRIFWGWTDGVSWKVAESPRSEFAREPVLYKFYVIREMSNPAELKNDPCIDFLKEFLPTLNETLTVSDN